MGNRIKAWNLLSRVVFILVFAASIGVFWLTRTGEGFLDFVINLVFAFVTSAEAEEFVRGRNMIPNLTYYYNHFATIHGLNGDRGAVGVINFIIDYADVLETTL